MSLPATLPDERQRFIIDRLARDGRVVVADLAREFATSEDTIRRDLRELAANGQCRRVYGGALPISPASGPLAWRVIEAPDRKAALGKTAALLIEPGQVVFIDAGSTNLAIAHALPTALAVTIVTNAPSIAAALASRPGVELIVIGGRVDPRIGAAVGARALRDMKDIKPDLAFLGACAVDAYAGVAAFDSEEAEFKRRVAEAARVLAIAATDEKLRTSAPFCVVPISALRHLVVEATVPAQTLLEFANADLIIHRASPPGDNP